MNGALVSLQSLIPALIGGVGLFLVGMILMTDGLKAAAGSAMQRILELSTGRPVTAFLSGVGLTALVQSSSATTIATIGFVSAGLLSLPGAVGVIIGANVGTTSTGWIVSLLGFKLNVGTMALPLIGVGALLRLLSSGRRANLGMALRLARSTPSAEIAVSIALFHTVFNLVGALLFLPFTRPLSRWVVRLVPDRGPGLTRHLDRSLLEVPAVAVEATARVLFEATAVSLEEIHGLLVGGQVVGRDGQARLQAARTAVKEARAFLAQVRLDQHEHEQYGRRLALLHASDHVIRLVEAALTQERPLHGTEALVAGRRLAKALLSAAACLRQPSATDEGLVDRLAATSAGQAGQRRRHRAFVLARTAAGTLPPDQTQAGLESMQWVDRVGYHTWRALHHLYGVGTGTDSAVFAGPEVNTSNGREGF